MRSIKQSWIDSYVNWIEPYSESPRNFHQWAAATVIAGACKRNVWVNRGDYNLYPNMFTILVAHTGLGKGRAINPVVNLLRQSGVANILSDKLTIQYILEKISDRGQMNSSNIQLNQTTQGTISLSVTGDATCFISAPEVEDLLMASDATSSLKELWEAKDGPFEYGTRGKGLVKIIKPAPTLIGGCTPSQIAMLFPNQAIGGGFVRRVNFVYEPERKRRIPWPDESNAYDPVKEALIADLKHINQLKGSFKIDPTAKQMFTEYYNRTGCDEFSDEATSSYDTSKPFHVLKLVMALSVSRNDSLIINFIDMARAIEMVNQCSADMQKVFRAVGDSESAVVIDKVLRFIEVKSKASYVTRHDLLRVLWRDIGSAQNLDNILATLEAGRIIRLENTGNVAHYRIVKAKMSDVLGAMP